MAGKSKIWFGTYKPTKKASDSEKKLFLGIRDGRYVGGRLENYTDEPEKLAEQIEPALRRVQQVVDARIGAEPFALIPALMNRTN